MTVIADTADRPVACLQLAGKRPFLCRIIYLEQFVMQSFDDLPVQDAGKTKGLIQALGEDRYLELISLIPPEVEKILERYHVPDDTDSSDLAFVDPDRRRDAHTLKGLAGNYGLPRLEHTARALESENLSDDELDQLLVRLQTCIAEIITIGNR